MNQPQAVAPYSLSRSIKYSLPAILSIFPFIGMITIDPYYKYGGVIVPLILLSLLWGSHWKQLPLARKITEVIILYYLLLSFLLFVGYWGIALFMTLSEVGIEQFLIEHEQTAIWIYLGISFAQPIFLPIPEIVPVVAASAVLGSFYGFILAFIGSVLGILTMFFLARKVGQATMMKFVKQEQMTRYQAYVQKNETLVLLILFLIPIIPDEIICVGAGLSGVTVRKFMLLAVLSKSITSSLLAYSVALVQWSGLSITTLLLLIGAVVILFYLGVIYIKKKLLNH